MSSFKHDPSPSSPFPDDSFWDVPRLHKDKRYRESHRPVTALARPPQQQVGASEPQQRTMLLDYKAKSSTSVPTLQSFGSRLSPGSSADMPSSRFSFDGQSLLGSTYSQTDRPDSIAQNLRSKGSRFMRRQNSKFNLRTLEWVEDSDELWTRGHARHNRIQSTGVRPEISEPYNFQHLTHTHSRHFQQMSRASHHDLVSEFSAIRAAQTPHRELQGIKAECLQSRKFQSEPTSPARQSFTTLPLSPTRYTQVESATSAKVHRSPSADFFSQPSPRLYKDRSPTSPIAPPPRFSSRRAAPDASMHHHEPSLEEPVCSTTGLATSSRLPEEHSPIESTVECLDYSNVPHAVTTPDDSAYTLKSPSFRVSGAELADVPEEDDDEKSTATSPSRPSTSSSSLRQAKSFHSIRTSSQSSRSPKRSKARDSESLSSRYEDFASQSEAMLPLVGEPEDDIPCRPRFSKRISLKAQGFDASWEDDIDYCYEHAAEADCDFDWDRVSILKEHEATDSRARSISEGCQDLYQEPSPNLSQVLPRLETSVPSLYSTDSAKSLSFSSIAGPATPSYPLPSPRPHGLPAKGSISTSADYPPSTPLLVSQDSSSQLHVESYENIFFNKHYHEEALPLHTLRFDPPGSREDSPRSSRSPISKCNSQESFMISRPSSLRHLRSTESMGSLPDLVHSKCSRDGFNITQEQAVELASTLKASESLLDQQQSSAPIIRQRTSQSLAKEVARQSMLQKAASFGSFDEEEEHQTDEVVILPSITHHERSQSAAVPQPAGPTCTQRKRSATAAAATRKRVSYSLFPIPPARTP